VVERRKIVSPGNLWTLAKMLASTNISCFHMRYLLTQAFLYYIRYKDIVFRDFAKTTNYKKVMTWKKLSLLASSLWLNKENETLQWEHKWLKRVYLWSVGKQSFYKKQSSDDDKKIWNSDCRLFGNTLRLCSALVVYLW